MNERTNAVRWRPGRHGLYEVWYLTLQDPDSGWAFWFRYTLEAPTDPGAASQAYLWAFAFPPSDEAGPASELQLLDRYSIDRFANRSRWGRFAIELGPAWLDRQVARGRVGSGARRIAWELGLGRSSGSYRHVSPGLFHARVASTAVATPILSAPVSGTITVGERRFVIRRAVAEQGHVYGRRHADRWTWAHCHEFEGAPQMVFEGVSGQVSKLGLLLPPASPLMVRDRAQGLDLAWNGARAMWSPVSQFGLGYWSFEAEQGDRLLRGVVSAPLESFIRVEYRDPDGSPVWCNHSEAGDVTLELLERAGGDWTSLWRREAHGTAAFEFGDRVRDDRPPRRLDQAEARPG